MEQATTQQEGQARPVPISKLYLENTLLRVAGVLFCHDQKRAATHTEEIEINGSLAERKIAVRPDPRLGQPGPLAHKLFVALLKKQSDYGRPAQADISFSKRELMRLIGRKDWGGRSSEQLTRALKEIHYTFVSSSFRTGKGSWAEHSFSIFPEIYLERAERESDPIERCTVTLAKPIVASLQDDHFTCLNHGLMQELGTIGQAFYMRLFYHFANLYDGHHKSRLTFPKRYDDICREWLGGLKVHAHRSLVERDQLGPHLRALVRADFLASYSITKAKNGNGMILTFRPGRAFFADYDGFYRRRSQGEIQFEFHEERREQTEPLKVAYLFLEKRDRRPLAAIPYVSSRDVETARQILTTVSFDEVGKFIEFGLAQAQKTNFDVQTIGGLKQYLTVYQREKVSNEASKAADDNRRDQARLEALNAAYEQFRSKRADSILVSLSPQERAAIEDLARASSKTPRVGYMAGALHRAACRHIVLERYAERIPNVKVWEAQFKQL